MRQTSEAVLSGVNRAVTMFSLSLQTKYRKCGHLTLRRYVPSLRGADTPEISSYWKPIILMRISHRLPAQETFNTQLVIIFAKFIVEQV